MILSDKGEVFTVEKEPAHWEVIDHITIEGRDGESAPARIDRLLINAPGRIVRIEGSPAARMGLAEGDMLLTITPPSTRARSSA